MKLPVLQNETFTNFTDFVEATNDMATDYVMTSDQPIVEFPHMMKYLHVFTGITAAVVLFGVLRALHAIQIMVQASKFFHVKMLDAILRCPISFLDNNPIGKSNGQCL